VLKTLSTWKNKTPKRKYLRNFIKTLGTFNIYELSHSVWPQTGVCAGN